MNVRLSMIVRLFHAALGALAGGLSPLARAESATASSGALTGQIVSLVIGLGVVLGVIFGAAWLVKRVAPRNYASAGVLRVVAGTAVGQRERVVVVEVGATWLVLGVTAGSVNMLHQMAPVATAAPDAAPAGATPPFAAWLKQMLEKRNGR